jgi:uncharacterized membrane protein YjgN (DUF898 family)
MRGIATVIMVGFISILLFGVFAPAAVEPIGDFVVNDPTVQDSEIDADGFQQNLYSVLFVWAPLLVLASGVVFAVRWYLKRERITGRRI